MPINGILSGFNEQRSANTNYLAQLDSMQRAAVAQALDKERVQNQQQQFAQELAMRQQQGQQSSELDRARMAQQGQQFDRSFGLQNQEFGLKQKSELGKMNRDEQARNALSQMLADGGDVDITGLGRAVLPYDSSTGINLIKAGKEEQRQQALLDRTGGTGVSAPQGYRWTQTGNLEHIPGGAADPQVMAQLEAVKAGAKGTKLTAEQQKIVDASNAGMSTIDRAIKLSSENKNVFGQSRGLAENFPLLGGPSLVSLVGKFDSPTEQAARGAVFQEAATVAHELLGSAQSPSEKASVQAFLPSSSDNADQVGVKLAGLKKLMQMKRDAVLTGAPPSYGDDQASNDGQQPQTHNSLPDPRQYNGKIARDTSTGTRWMSNGRDWVRAP